VTAANLYHDASATGPGAAPVACGWRRS